jgi:hypothetical protein
MATDASTRAPAGAKPKAEVISLFGRPPRLDEEPEIRVGLPPAGAASSTSASPLVAALDLSDRPKAWLLIGAGGGGKTTLARWMGWRMHEAGRTALLAALDPQNRSLASWFSGVEQPPTSDGAQSARWLRTVLKYLMAEKHSACLDFGGGDTALARLLDTAPEFAEAMAEAGVEPVACYVLTPRVDDLASLESFEAMGFKPLATAIVLNEGKVDSTLGRDEAFARIRRHSAFRAAVDRGAVPVWMPRLEPEVAAEIEGKRLQFGHARDGLVPPGAGFAPIGGLERSMVRRWLERMEREFEPLRTWLL